MATSTKKTTGRAKTAATQEKPSAPDVETAPADSPAELLPSKPSPIVAPPRVIVEMESIHDQVETVRRYTNLLLDLAGVNRVQGRQWMADAVDAANRFILDFRAKIPGAVLAKNTVFRAVKNGAGTGLSFNHTLGQLWLVPFKNGRLSEQEGRDIYDCQLIVGYQGYEALAYGLDWLDTLFVEVVLADEIDETGSRFKYWHDESGPHLYHRPKIPRTVPRSMKDAQHVIDLGYASWRTVRGSVAVAVADRGRIARAVNRYSDMWKWDFPAGVKKTAVREAAKHWPKTRPLSGALLLDDQAERDVEQDDITGRRIPELDGEVPRVAGPPAGGVAGLGDDDADESPAFLDLSRRVEERREAPQLTEQAIASALQEGTIDDDQAGRLSDRLADVAATPKPTETLDSDEIPW